MSGSGRPIINPDFRRCSHLVVRRLHATSCSTRCNMRSLALGGLCSYSNSVISLLLSARFSSHFAGTSLHRLIRGLDACAPP